MKNVLGLYSPAEAKEYISKLWKTDHFKNSEYVGRWVDKISQNPMAFAEMSDQDLEYSHFGTWFGITYRRDYNSPVISDLYYFHELVHSGLMHYEPNTAFSSWFRKMNKIEFNASLETEGFVYLEIPELRAVSLKDEIWADRFLGQKSYDTKDIMKQERYKALHDPDPFDFCEQQIAAYVRQNFEWSMIWKQEVTLDGNKKPAYLHVEKKMDELRTYHNLDEYLTWLEQMGDIPFPDQARMFADVYWKNKLGYKSKY